MVSTKKPLSHCYIVSLLLVGIFDGNLGSSDGQNDKHRIEEVVHTVSPKTVVQPLSHSQQADKREYAHRPSVSMKSLYMSALFPYAYRGFPYNYYGYPYDYKYGFPVGHGIYRQTQHTAPENFKCPGDGHFYRNEVSFYSCAGLEFRVLFCAPGTKNASKVNYTAKLVKQKRKGDELEKQDFCSVNLVSNAANVASGVKLNNQNLA